MARAVQAIEKDLRALGGQATDLGQQFQQVYAAYLQQLGRVLRHQLALAGYQVCTQKYPDAFLQLALRQQQDLQGALRQLGKAAAEQLNVEKIAAEEEDAGAGADADASEAGASESTLATATAAPESVPPEYWLAWVQRCEDAIAQILQKTSIATNELLQKLGILPEQLPIGALEVAARAREPGTPNAANLSEITVELRARTPEGEEETEKETVTAAIVQLRLGDLELADPTLQGQRRRLQELGRNLGASLTKYRRVTQEQAVARAELAWRTSWFDED